MADGSIGDEMKRLLFAVILILLAACERDTSGDAFMDAVKDHLAEISMPEFIATNVLSVAEPYSYTPPVFTLEQHSQYANVGSDGTRVCMVLWQALTTYARACWNYASDGPFPVNCPISQITSQPICNPTYSVMEFILATAGPSRELTAEELALTDALLRATYCDAPRLDGADARLEDTTGYCAQ